MSTLEVETLKTILDNLLFIEKGIAGIMIMILLLVVMNIIESMSGGRK